MKRIGIIGGLGPIATVKFMELLNREIETIKEEIEMVVINDPTTPDRTEYILDNQKENPIKKIIAMVKKLELANCDVIVMPCNTASYFYKEILNSTKIPFINIVLETVHYLNEKKVKKIGLLATEGTIKSQIYSDLLNDFQMDCLIPTKEDQQIISSVIYDGVKGGNKINLDDFYQVINHLKEKGAEGIILGCTELSALKQIYNLNDEILIDAMEVLANHTIEFIKCCVK